MSEGFLSHDWFSRSLPANCRLGDRSWLYSSFAFIHCRCERPSAIVVGEDTGLYNGTFFDLGPNAEVCIGRFCSIVGAILCTDHRITIGDYVFISHEVVIADRESAVPPNGAHFGNGPARDNCDVTIADDVWIGAQAIILGGVTIGAGAVVGAAAVVDQDIPPFAIFAGNPGRVVGSVPRD